MDGIRMIVWIEDGYIKWFDEMRYYYFRDSRLNPPWGGQYTFEICESWMVLK